MKKDFIYEDKGRFKLLQNARRIGGFYVGDQGIIPGERVLPEQRFAHQPILRRPPEEVLKFAYGEEDGFLIYCVDRGIGPDGNEKSLKGKKLIKMKDPLDDGASEAERKFIKGEALSPSERSILEANFLWCTDRISPPPDHPELGKVGKPLIFDDSYYYVGWKIWGQMDGDMILIKNFTNKLSVNAGVVGIDVEGTFTVDHIAIVYKEGENYKLIFGGYSEVAADVCWVKCTSSAPQGSWSVEQIYLEDPMRVNGIDVHAWAVNSLYLPIISSRDTKDFACLLFPSTANLNGENSWESWVGEAYYKSFKMEIEERLGPPAGPSWNEYIARQYPFLRKGDSHLITVVRSSTVWGLETKRIDGKNIVYRKNAKYIVDLG